MATATRMNRDLGSYHGSGEGMARFAAIVGLFAFFIALLLPWLGAWIFSQHHHYTLSAAMRVTGELSPFRLLMLDVLAFSIAVTLSAVFRSLSQRIALGGAEANFLDRLRVQIASLCMSAGLLFLFLIAPR